MTQDIVRESTMKFILESERTMNLAAHIEDALLEIRKQSVKLAIKGVENYFLKWSSENKDWKFVSDLRAGNIMRMAASVSAKIVWRQKARRASPWPFGSPRIIGGHLGGRFIFARFIQESATT